MYLRFTESCQELLDQEILRRHREFFGKVRSRRRGCDIHKAVGVREWQRVEQHGVDDTEDPDVGPFKKARQLAYTLDEEFFDLIEHGRHHLVEMAPNEARMRNNE